MNKFEYGHTYPLKIRKRNGIVIDRYLKCTGRRASGKIRFEEKDKVIIAFVDETDDCEIAILPSLLGTEYLNISANEVVK